MTLCSYCGTDFLLLSNNTGLETGQNRCGKCILRKPGLSQPELAEINNKPQCVTCGIVSILIKKPLCNRCIDTYKKMDNVPRAVLILPGMAAILLDNPIQESNNTPETGVVYSSEALSVIAAAVGYQTQASDSRLKNKPSTSKGSEEASGLNKFKNLSKATHMLAERKKQKDEIKLAGIGNTIRISVTLWSLDEAKNKMTQLTGIRVSQTFGPERKVQVALESLLLCIRPIYMNRFPEARPLMWDDIHLYAHENQANYFLLDYFDREKTVAHLLQEFIAQKFGSETSLKDRKLDIRFVFTIERMFVADDAEDVGDSYRPSIARRLQSTKTLVGTTRKSERVIKDTSRVSKKARLIQDLESNASHQAITDSFAMPAIPEHRSSGRVLLSSFRVDRWSRNIEMRTCKFQRTTAHWAPHQGLKVNFKTLEEYEDIEIAKEWKDKASDGFIGEGWSKYGIYARYMGQEYVITQYSDTKITELSVKNDLHAEYALLCIGDGLKKEFDRHAKFCGVVSMPKFYFNFEHSFIGELVPTTSNGRYLPHRYFIATLMLPCGEVNAKIRKFTGNDEFGTPEDNLTKAIHAFSHFTAVYTKDTLVLCDLQGLNDRQGTMCLIDPQGHTSSNISPSNNSCFAYWDGGSRKMKEYLSKHIEGCKLRNNNWICGALNLCDATVEEDDGTRFLEEELGAA